MRIVCAVHDYPPQRVTGSARQARQLCRHLARRGHSVTVVTSSRPTGVAEDPPDDGVAVHRVRRGLRSGWGRHVEHPLRRWIGRDDFGLAEPLSGSLHSAIRNARPDLILAVAASTREVVAAAQAARRLDVPSVVFPAYHMHDDGFAADRAGWRKVLASFDSIMVATQEEAQHFLAQGIASERIVHYTMFVEPPIPIPETEVRRWRQAHGVDDALLVVAAGSYAAIKGIWTLARASLALPDVRFVLFGGDARAQRRLEHAIPVGPNTRFAGFVDEREKSRLLHAADLVAMPSRADSFGLIYVEANACGTPAVAADLPAMREVLGVAGLFVPLDDAEALARMIRGRSVAEWRDPRIAEAARRNASRFGMRATLDRLAEVIERSVDAHSRADSHLTRVWP